MKRFVQLPPWSAMLACLAVNWGGSVALADDEQPARFVRLTHDDEGVPTALQTSIARYVGTFRGKPITVDLVGAVHLADRDYYQQLNRLFPDYDVVLYEFVAPEGLETPDPNRRSSGPLALLQGSLRAILGLESQLEQVDYSPPNFVHADMSPQELSEAIRSRGDNMFSFMLSALADLARQADVQAQQLDGAELEDFDFDPLAMLTDADAGHKLKVQMARQFDRMGETNLALGATMTTLVVEDRNQAALKVLDQQLAKDHQRIAIFYGAAHMNDFAQRLDKDYGLRHADTRWLTAWDLRKGKTAPPSLASTLFRLLQSATEDPSGIE